jgi:hypothetical protein
MPENCDFEYDFIEITITIDSMKTEDTQNCS